MDAPLSHISAAEFWMAYGRPGCPKAKRIRHAENGLGGEPGSFFETPSKKLAERYLCLGFLSDPVHVVVSCQSARRSILHLASHSRTRPMPPGSIMEIEGVGSVCAPTLAFAQMGAVLDFPRLVWFGSALCGIFSMAIAGEDAAGEEDLPARRQLVTAEKMRGFLSTAPRMPGAERARRALPYVVERARSPMEIFTALMLSLPRRYGGFGLPHPRMNLRVDLPEWLHGARGFDAAGFEGRAPHAECDMRFEHAGKAVYVDYHGADFHTGATHLEHDALRANALEELQIVRFTITRTQALNIALLEKTADQIRKSLGLRDDQRIGDLAERRRRLHRSLLAASFGNLGKMD